MAEVSVGAGSKGRLEVTVAAPVVEVTRVGAMDLTAVSTIGITAGVIIVGAGGLTVTDVVLAVRATSTEVLVTLATVVAAEIVADKGREAARARGRPDARARGVETFVGIVVTGTWVTS